MKHNHVFISWSLVKASIERSFVSAFDHRTVFPYLDDGCLAGLGDFVEGFAWLKACECLGLGLVREYYIYIIIDEVVEECGPLLGRDDGRDALFRRDLDGLSRESSLVYEAFPATGSCTPSVLAESAGVPVEQVRAALTLLELDGLVVLVDGGWRRA